MVLVLGLIEDLVQDLFQVVVRELVQDMAIFWDVYGSLNRSTAPGIAPKTLSNEIPYLFHAKRGFLPFGAN